MNQRQRYLPIKELTPGMVLGDDLLDKMGHVLLPANAVLTQKMINGIQQHGINQLLILSEDAEESEEEKQFELQRREKKLGRLKTIFRHEPYDEPTSILKGYIEKYRGEPSS